MKKIKEILILLGITIVAIISTINATIKYIFIKITTKN